MARYDYKCCKCGYVFEVSHPISDSSVRHCPKCNSECKKLISSSVSFQFKGSGFYCTDYKKK